MHDLVFVVANSTLIYRRIQTSFAEPLGKHARYMLALSCHRLLTHLLVDRARLTFTQATPEHVILLSHNDKGIRSTSFRF